ncbi:MAG: VOC family protein, partial [Thermomicrobiales bacterium]
LGVSRQLSHEQNEEGQMRYAWTVVAVEDVAGTIAFWERAFGLERRFVSEDGTYGELKTGETTISFAHPSISAGHGVEVDVLRLEGKPAGVELALATDDVAAAFARAVAAGAAALKEPEVMPWGQTVSWVRDPNGVLIELCTPIG